MDNKIRELERRSCLGDPIAEQQLLRLKIQAGVLPANPIISLIELLGESSNLGSPYYHHDVLSYILAFAPKLKLLNYHSEDGYHGTEYGLLFLEDNHYRYPIYILWRNSFGSCSGCDGWLAACDGSSKRDYAKATLAEGNTKQFWSLEEAKNYISGSRKNRAERYLWDGCPLSLFILDGSYGKS